MTYQVDGRDGIDVNEFIELGSLLKYKIRQHKTESRFSIWAKSLGRLGNGFEFFQRIVSRENFKKISQIVLLMNLVQVRLWRKE